MNKKQPTKTTPKTSNHGKRKQTTGSNKYESSLKQKDNKKEVNILPLELTVDKQLHEKETENFINSAVLKDQKNSLTHIQIKNDNSDGEGPMFIENYSPHEQIFENQVKVKIETPDSRQDKAKVKKHNNHPYIATLNSILNDPTKDASSMNKIVSKALKNINQHAMDKNSKKTSKHAKTTSMDYTSMDNYYKKKMTATSLMFGNAIPDSKTLEEREQGHFFTEEPENQNNNKRSLSQSISKALQKDNMMDCQTNESIEFQENKEANEYLSIEKLCKKQAIEDISNVNQERHYIKNTFTNSENKANANWELNSQQRNSNPLFKNASVVINRNHNTSLAESIIPENSKISRNPELPDFTAKYVLQSLAKTTFHDRKNNQDVTGITEKLNPKLNDSKNISLILEKHNENQEEFEGQVFLKLSGQDDPIHTKLSTMKSVNDNLRCLKDFTEKKSQYMLKTYETMAPYYFIKYDNLFSKFISSENQEKSQILKVATSPNDRVAFCCDQKGNLVSWNYEGKKQQHRKSYGLIGIAEEQTINRKSAYENHFLNYRIKTMVCIDNFLFISYYCSIIKQYDIKDMSLVKAYNKFHEGGIVTIIKSSIDTNYIYTADDQGWVKQFSFKDRKLIPQNERYLINFLVELHVSYCDKFLFLLDGKGILKQMKQTDFNVVKEYGIAMNISKVLSDNFVNIDKNKFTRQNTKNSASPMLRSNSLKKSFAESSPLLKSQAFSLSKIEEMPVEEPKEINLCMAVSKDYAFVSYGNKLKQYSLIKKTLVNDMTLTSHDVNITSLCASKDNSYLYTSDENGILRKFSITENRLIEDYGKIFEGSISFMCIDNKSKYLFTTDTTGTMKQFFVKPVYENPVDKSKKDLIDKDFETGQKIRICEEFYKCKDDPSDAFKPNGKGLANKEMDQYNLNLHYSLSQRINGLETTIRTSFNDKIKLLSNKVNSLQQSMDMSEANNKILERKVDRISIVDNKCEILDSKLNSIESKLNLLLDKLSM